MKIHYFNSVVFILSLVQIAYAGLSDILHNYETLHHTSMRHHVAKRDIYSQHPNEREVEYDTLGRHFHLHLHRVSTPAIAPNVKIVAVDEYDHENVVDYKPVIYHGYLQDEPETSTVSAYWEDSNVMNIAVNTSTDVYIVEPSWRHLPSSSKHTMISYRGSDIKMDKDVGKAFCGYAKAKSNDEDAQLEDVEDSIAAGNEHRTKRAVSCTSSGQTTCPLLLVADYRFYKNMSLGSIPTTTSYLFLQIDRINSIYNQHPFGQCGKGFGFEIKEIRIHTRPTVTSGEMHYNMDKTDWDTTGLLEVFSRDSKFKKFCMVHLFTYTSFNSGVLGLAYIGSPRPFSVGGICSPPYEEKGGARTLYLNTGWSSSLNRYGRRLLTQEAMLVTAHGHNWGSEHDPDSKDCSPSAAAGGKYIMYTYSVSGIDTNNRIFSPCSMRSIGAVLASKAETCFKEPRWQACNRIAPSGSFCGNMVVEKDEQCDVGAGQSDKCCDANCRLIRPAKCSDANEICCKDCQYANRSTVCAQASLCVGDAHCSGTSTKCEQPPAKENGSVCLDKGRCVNGTCVTLCEYYGKISCVCDTVANSCKWCCRDKYDVNKTCEPYSNDTFLPDGMHCIQGFCHKGVCEKQIHDTIQRLWDIIENITVDKLVMFMRANIVGTVIVLSLVVWIPASCVVAHIDRRNEREHLIQAEWFDNQSTRLIQDEDTNQLTIVKVSKLKTRGSAPILKLKIPERANSSSGTDSVFT